MKHIIALITISLLLAGCSTYKKYARPDIDVASEYRNTSDLSDEGNSDTFGSKNWREIFTDSTLQSLITFGLENNTDLKIARLNVDNARAAIQKARLAFLPEFNLNAGAGTTRFDGATTDTYNIGLNGDIEIDLSGKLTNMKREAWSAFESAEAIKSKCGNSDCSNNCIKLL